jgi:hypothetical protein
VGSGEEEHEDPAEACAGGEDPAAACAGMEDPDVMRAPAIEKKRRVRACGGGRR